MLKFLAGLVGALTLLLVQVAAGAPKPPVKIRHAVCSVFKARCAQAMRVAYCESRWHLRAVGSAGERGIFQIHPVHFGWAKPGRLFDPRWNAVVAYRLSHGGRDWSAWTCSAR